jgi:ATP-dependent helicase/nuclease subunit B
MQSFLEQFTAHITAKHGDQISDVCVILPSQRAGLFLKTHLSRQLEKTIWSPRIITIHEFIESICEYEILDTTSLLFELYDTYKQIEGEEAEPFEKFSKWGGMLLADFNEVDRYMISAEQLYTDLRNIKDIDNWSFHEEELTESQQNYMSFWEKLGIYYDRLNEKLEKSGRTYEGKAYKMIASNMQKYRSEITDEKIYFAGFNALSNAESNIINYLRDIGKAELFWDMDSHYVDNKAHEAGLFYRRYKKHWKNNQFNAEFNDISTTEKNINIIGVPQNVGQAKVAGDILSKIETDDFRSIALVLADENLLLPTLNSIPDNVKTVNVTMGYPLKNTPLHTLFDAVFTLHENARRFGGSEEDHRFHYKDFLKIINHSYFRGVLVTDENAHLAKDISAQIFGTNKVFISKADLAEFAEEAFDRISFLFTQWQKFPNDPLQCFHQLIGLLKDHFGKDDGKNKMELEYLYHYAKAIKKLQTLFDRYAFIDELSSFKSIFHQTVSASSLAFFGEPLQGLQLMGMLETRLLDFETVILLSVNENTLPKAKQETSFIPFDLKKFHRLPTYQEKDAIYAYHFYHLLQRAKNVYLLYNTENDDFGSGEQSRFLTQLQHELPRENITIKEQVLSIPVVQNETKPLSIPKDAAISWRLDSLLEAGLSPSALSTYINCPMDFYFKYILGLREADEVEETIEASTLGSFVHGVLEELYTPFVNKNVTVPDVKAMLPKVEKLTKKQFKSKYGGKSQEWKFGQNFLILKVAMKFIERFLRSEIKLLEETGQELLIKSLEESHEAEIEVVIDGKTKKALLRGNMDRVDVFGRTLRIIDYKTGTTATRDVNVKELTDVATDSKYSKSFQLLTYGLIYSKQHPQLHNFTSGIISLKNLSNGLLNVNIDKNDQLNSEVLGHFEVVIKQLIASMYDTHTHWEHNEDSDYCKFCN